jgi:hypothetical protein
LLFIFLWRSSCLFALQRKSRYRAVIMNISNNNRKQEPMTEESTHQCNDFVVGSIHTNLLLLNRSDECFLTAKTKKQSTGDRVRGSEGKE